MAVPPPKAYSIRNGLRYLISEGGFISKVAPWHRCVKPSALYPRRRFDQGPIKLLNTGAAIVLMI